MALAIDRATESLQILTQITRLLAAERPLAPRAPALFTLLRDAVPFRDGRLTCWFQSARPGTTRQQFYSPDGWPYLWDDELARSVALGGQTLVRSADLRPRATSGERLPVVQAAYLGAPIFWEGRLWGILELRSDAQAGFDQRARELVVAIQPQLAAAIMAEGQRQSPDALALAESPAALALAQERQISALAVEMEEPLTLPQLLARLLRAALAGTGAEAGAISLVDHEQGELVLQLHEGYPPGWPALDLQSGPRQRSSWESGLSGRAARTGRALLVRDVTQEGMPHVGPAGIRAELAAPVLSDGRAAAIITLDSPRSAAFGERELAFVQALCARAAAPLRRAERYQEALEASTHLGQVFSSLPTGLAILDSNGKVVRANPAWSLIWGLRGDLSHRPFHVSIDLVEAMLPRLVEPMRLTEFCADGQRSPAEAQTVSVRLNNPTQELLVLSVPTRDSQDQITGRIWAVSDVTREREVDRLKNEFVSIVSHELRTPLTSILGYTELLLNRDFGPDERRQFVKTVYDEANRLSQLVEDLLGVSRLDAGKVKLSQWVVSLRQIVAELTNQLNTQLQRHRLLIRYDDLVPPVFIDRDKIKQVLHNLLTNAIKYSPEGGEIELAIHPARMRELPADHPRGRWVLVTVRDTGIGIAPEDLPRIWERFYRVDNTNTRRIGGTGLGLSITRALVELHGGRAWAESTLGVGSTFFFTVPVAEELPRRR